MSAAKAMNVMRRMGIYWRGRECMTPRQNRRTNSKARRADQLERKATP